MKRLTYSSTSIDPSMLGDSASSAELQACVHYTDAKLSLALSPMHMLCWSFLYLMWPKIGGPTLSRKYSGACTAILKGILHRRLRRMGTMQLHQSSQSSIGPLSAKLCEDRLEPANVHGRPKGQHKCSSLAEAPPLGSQDPH